MDDFVSFRRFQPDRYLYISSLSKSTVEDSDVPHLGDSGYFLYESSPSGIHVLAKVASLDAAMRLLDIYEEGFARAVQLGEKRARRGQTITAAPSG